MKRSVCCFIFAIIIVQCVVGQNHKTDDKSGADSANLSSSILDGLRFPEDFQRLQCFITDTVHYDFSLFYPKDSLKEDTLIRFNNMFTIPFWDFEDDYLEDSSESTALATELPNPMCAYPNPFQSELSFKSESPIIIYICDLKGKLLEKIHLDGFLILDCSNYPPGTYLIRDGKGSLLQKLIKISP